MGVISIPDETNGTSADANDLNSRFATVLGLVNGNIDSANIKAGGVATANIATSAVTTDKIADASITAAKVSSAIEIEVARATQSVAGTTLDVPTFTAYKYLKIYIWTRATGGTTNIGISFNGDNASGNYSRSNSANFAAVASTASENFSQLSGASATPQFAIIEVVNQSGFEKQITAHVNDANTAGAANVPQTRETFAKWAGTNQATSMRLQTSGTGQFNVGTEIIIYGHN